MKDNELISSILHFIGALLSIAALVIMIVIAAKSATPLHIVSFSIFGASMTLLYSASTTYHFLNRGTKAKDIFKRIDHSLIYVLIAGTYTPICLILLKGMLGWTLLALVWSMAVLGIVIKSIWSDKYKKISTAMYVVMGWIIIIAFDKLNVLLPKRGLFWLIFGGVSYTLGAAVYTLEHYLPRPKWFGMHEIFHLFVMIGSFSHFWVIFRYLMGV